MTPNQFRCLPRQLSTMTACKNPLGTSVLFFGGVLCFYCLFLLNTSNKEHVGLTRFPGRWEQLSTYNKPSPWLVEAYKSQAAERHKYLDLIAKSDELFGYGYLYNNLAPEVYCAEKVKVGTTNDGGKWMCSPQNLPEDCVIFALGIAGMVTYEDDIQRYSEQRCRIISVDSAKQSEDVIEALKNIRGIAIPAMVGKADTAKTMTMEKILSDNSAREVEILKIDIEGSEFETMGDFLEKYTVSQILIEVHGNPQQAVNLLRLISSKGYLLFHYEINGRYHTLAEYAFIHKSRLERYHATVLAPFITL